MSRDTSASDAPRPGVPLPPGAARRRELRQQRQAERLRNLWRLIVFSALSAGLGYSLLRQGWILRQPSQVEVVGSTQVSRDQVIQAAQLHFPQPLLGLQPRELVRSLSAARPVEQVKVTRLMLPPRLRVELLDREAVARAERRSVSGVEQGYVDRVGNWISVRQNLGVQTKGNPDLAVKGWNERHRAPLAQVLASRDSLGAGLREIRFEADGSLWLTTQELGDLRLGPVDRQLMRRLEVATHLNRTLPGELKGRRPQLIDLSDPEQPELSLSGPIRSASDGGPASAQKPRGAQ